MRRVGSDKSLAFMIGSLIGICFLVVVKLAISVCIAWFLFSACVSGLKVGTKNCGNQYKIEQYSLFDYHLDGDFFCPVKK